MTQGLELPTVADQTPRSADRDFGATAGEGRRTLLRGGAVSRKLPRVLLLAAVVAGLGVAPMTSASASSGIDVFNPENGGFSTGTPDHHTDINKGDSVTWYIKEGTHTVTPDNNVQGGTKWPTAINKPSGDLNVNDHFDVTFDKAAAGKYFYHCEKHPEMTGFVNVKDPNATTTTTTAPPEPTTTTTLATPSTTTPTSATPGTTATTRPVAVGPQTTPTTAKPTTTTKPEKDKKGKDETTTTTAPPPPVAPDLPDSAIIPALPGSDTTSTTVQGGVEAPGSAPEGDAVALLKSKKKGGDAVKLLIVSGIGLGALGFGAAGYKFANRSSKYFPA
jgi:plastocyanin